MLDIQKKSRIYWESLWRAAARTKTRADGRSVAFLGNSRSPCGLSGAGFATVKPLSEKNGGGNSQRLKLDLSRHPHER